MKELLKRIREYLGYSQAKLSKRLHVSYATINRWENEHFLPNKLAQQTLFRLCEENNVPVYEMILSEIKEAVGSIKLNKDSVILYHGSKGEIEGNITPSSRFNCDFGPGFYMGNIPEQPLTLICDFEQAKFYILSLDLTNLDVIEIPPDIDWALLIAYYRGKMKELKDTPIYKKYESMLRNKDIVIGAIADDRIFQVLDNFFLGIITDKALLASLSALQLGKQYVAISDKATKAIKIEREFPLGYLEKKVLSKVSQENRQKGIKLADSICKEYRREGLFFDEIITK